MATWVQDNLQAKLVFGIPRQELGNALLRLAIIASLLVDAGNMAFLSDIVGNITALFAELGNAGLPGLIALGVVLFLLN